MVLIGTINSRSRTMKSLKCAATSVVYHHDGHKSQVKGASKGQQLTTQQMLEAGLGDEEDVYLRVNDLKFVKQRTIGPDVLDVIMRSYKVKGTNAMRLMLRTRGAPDKTSSMLPVSPKQIKDLATQLGILGNYHFYW